MIKNKAKRKLTNITFDFIGSHIAYTDESQGGAASLKNKPYLLKSNEDIDKNLTKEQEEILALIEEESTPLDKNLNGEDINSMSSSTEVDNGEDNVNKNKDEEDMSEDILKQEVAALRKELAINKAEKITSKFNFDKELNKALAEAISELKQESLDLLEKAFTVLVEAKDKAVEEALEKANTNSESDLIKTLKNEEGHEAIAEDQVEKSLVDQVKELRAAEKENK